VMAFEQWQDWVAWRDQSDERLEMLRLKHGWHMQSLLAGLKQNHRTVVRSALHVWATATAEALRFDVVCKRVLRRWQLVRVTLCFREWVEFSDSRRHMRRLAGRVFARVVYGKAASAWASWLEVVVYMKRYESVCLKAAARMRQSSVLRAFVRWEEYRIQRQRLRRVVRFHCSWPCSFLMCV
jgi:hypothetical protein